MSLWFAILRGNKMAISQEFQQKLDLYSKARSHTPHALRLRYFLWLLADKGCNTAPAIEGTIWNSRVKLNNVRLGIKERMHTTETKRKSEAKGEPVDGVEHSISTVRQATYVGQIWRRCLCPGDSCGRREETWENTTVIQVSVFVLIKGSSPAWSLSMLNFQAIISFCILHKNLSV